MKKWQSKTGAYSLTQNQISQCRSIMQQVLKQIDFHLSVNQHAFLSIRIVLQPKLLKSVPLSFGYDKS